MSANIHPGCRAACCYTIARPDLCDVRRCEHGRVWVANGTWTPGLSLSSLGTGHAAPGARPGLA